MVAFPYNLKKDYVMPKKSSTHIEHDANETTQTSRDELATLIRDALNKAQKDGGKVAHFLDEQEDPSMVSDWISTGSTLLDLAISNRPNGGLPAGRIVELNGLESCVTEDTKIEIDISRFGCKYSMEDRFEI